MNRAFRAQDLAAAEALLVPGDAVVVLGSEDGELAVGRASAVQMLRALFSRPERYWWTLPQPHVRVHGDTAWLCGEGELHIQPVGPIDVQASCETITYRLTAVLVRVNGVWQWAHYHGSEPVPPVPAPATSDDAA